MKCLTLHNMEESFLIRFAVNYSTSIGWKDPVYGMPLLLRFLLHSDLKMTVPQSRHHLKLKQVLIVLENNEAFLVLLISDSWP